MLNNLATKTVSENLQWFFDKFLKDHYDRRRDALQEASKNHEANQELMPTIDYIFKTCLGPDTHYPPSSVALWNEYYQRLGSEYSHFFRQLLIVYLQMDISNYLSMRERESTTGRQSRTKDKAELSFLQTTLDKLSIISKCFDFKLSVIKMSTGLWALDNCQIDLMLSCLSDPMIDFSQHFEFPRDLVQLIVGALHCGDNTRMALYMDRIHLYESNSDEYDQMHAYLLISSGQLVEALKYERAFMEHEDYPSILQRFFELCSRLDVTGALNCLNLTVEEEEAWNRHSSEDNRSTVSPANSQENLNQRRRGHVSISTPPKARQSPATPQTLTSATTKTTTATTRTSFGGLNSSGKSATKCTPRNRNVHALRKVPSFNDSPARNTRSARKKKGN